MSEERFTAIEGRLTDVERAMNHYIGKFTGLETKVDTAIKNTDDILGIVDKGRKIFGIAISNWRTIMVFGAGIMTAIGADNQKLWEFLSQFAGG